jgi:ferredoxin-type protein NapG
MCPDVPCVPPCPTGALDINKLVSDSGTGEKPDINKSLMGLAVVDQESCIAFWGIQCDACYRACPLMDEAISLVYERNERTGKHAFLKPEVHSKACTGCGMCEHACITEKAAIRILPRDVAMGKVGDHYIKGWDEEDEQRLQNIMEAKDEPSDEVPAEDYLNNWEDLIDE